MSQRFLRLPKLERSGLEDKIRGWFPRHRLNLVLNLSGLLNLINRNLLSRSLFEGVLDFSLSSVNKDDSLKKD